jgi:hypothetical protein
MALFYYGIKVRKIKETSKIGKQENRSLVGSTSGYRQTCLLKSQRFFRLINDKNFANYQNGHKNQIIKGS